MWTSGSFLGKWTLDSHCYLILSLMIVVVTFLAHMFLVKLVYNFSSSEIITWLIEQVRQELKFDVLHLSSTQSLWMFFLVYIFRWMFNRELGIENEIWLTPKYYLNLLIFLLCLMMSYVQLACCISFILLMSYDVLCSNLCCECYMSTPLLFPSHFWIKFVFFCSVILKSQAHATLGAVVGWWIVPLNTHLKLVDWWERKTIPTPVLIVLPANLINPRLQHRYPTSVLSPLTKIKLLLILWKMVLLQVSDFCYYNSFGVHRCTLFLLWEHILLISSTTIDSNDWILDLVKCSGYQCGVHADICWWSFMPIHMLKAAGSWGVIGGLWLIWLCSCPNEGEAILDHQELLGWKLGREWVLQNLQGSQYLRSGLNGLDRCCCANLHTVGHEF